MQCLTQLLGFAKVIAGCHVAIIGASALFIAFPKPWTRPGKRCGTPADDGLAFEKVSLADDCPGWLVKGSGSCAICLCHGRSRHKAHLRPLIRALAPEYTVLAFDFPSHGENCYGPTCLGQTEAISVDLALDFLAQRGFERVLLYGCSMGGAAALISQSRRAHPCVQGIVTDGAFAAFSDVVEQKATFLPQIMRRYMVPTALFMAGCLAGYDPWAVRPIDSIANVEVPVLLLHGDADTVVPSADVTRLASRAAKATVQLYPGDHDQPASLDMHKAVLSFARKLMHHSSE